MKIRELTIPVRVIVGYENNLHYIAKVKTPYRFLEEADYKKLADKYTKLIDDGLNTGKLIIDDNVDLTLFDDEGNPICRV